QSAAGAGLCTQLWDALSVTQRVGERGAPARAPPACCRTCTKIVPGHRGGAQLFPADVCRRDASTPHHFPTAGSEDVCARCRDPGAEEEEVRAASRRAVAERTHTTPPLRFSASYCAATRGNRA